MSRAHIVASMFAGWFVISSFSLQSAEGGRPTAPRPVAATAAISTVTCDAVCQGRFAAARNAEINASIRTVEAARTEEARAASFAAEQNAQAIASANRVAYQRAMTFAEARNAEIKASIARVDEVRRLARIEIEQRRHSELSIERVQRARMARFAADRNAEIEASIVRVTFRRAAEFAAARNAEINRSVGVRQRPLKGWQSATLR